MREYIEKYKKELKTTDVEAIKKIIFQKVYCEVIGIEARKAAKKWYATHPDEDDSDDFDETNTKSLLKSINAGNGGVFTPRSVSKTKGGAKKPIQGREGSADG